MTTQNSTNIPMKVGGIATSASGGTSPDAMTNSGASSFLFGNNLSSTGANCGMFGIDNSSTGASNGVFGNNNTVSSTQCFVAGINHVLSASSNNGVIFGSGNTINSSAANSCAIGNGNTVSGSNSFCIGQSCSTTGSTTYALGNGAITLNNGSVVWVDNTGAGNSDSTTNQMNLTFSNGFRWFTGSAVLAASIDASSNFITAKGVVSQGITYLNPSTGFSQTIADGVHSLIIIAAGTLATGTITMPANPIEGQEIRVSMRGTITALTLNANSGQTMTNAPTTLTGGIGFSYLYRAANTTWYRLQ